MSKECIQQCPLIREIVEQTASENMWSGIGAVHTDYFAGEDTAANRLLRACENTYECQTGPGTTEVEVVKGFIKKRTEMVSKPTCGLSEKFQPEPTS